MIILAIDPGNKQSAYVFYDPENKSILEKDIVPNDILSNKIRGGLELFGRYDVMAIEMIACYGLPVGEEVFDTCVWVGRFTELAKAHVEYVFRRTVKKEVCGKCRSNDSKVRASLIELFGGKNELKKGGILNGFKKDLWAALGVAVTYAKQKSILGV